MSISVMRLIKELEKIENKFLEVECIVVDPRYISNEIDRIERRDKKIVIITKDFSNE